MAAAQGYPVRVNASLDAPLSRWLWLVKWFLLIPHYIVLTFLWLAFVVLSVAAFFAILFTGTYPRPIFDFNVGVLRWTWRVQYYAIGVFGTDRYPPFTLADDAAYPAHLDVAYPGRLSRGLVLIKWWLLAIPQYIIVGLFTGGGLWVTWRASDNTNWNWPGLIGILAVIAAIVLLVTGRYPQQIFDFVLGLNRWVLRVAAYAALMTDQYPPFRLDMGGDEPGGTLALRQPPPQSPYPAGQPGEPAAPPQPPGWTAGRIVSVVIGAVLAIFSLGLLGAGGAAWWADTAGRTGGYVDLGSAAYSTSGYALASDAIELHAMGTGWDAARGLFGTVRLRATATDGTTPVFIGIASPGAASHYLAGMSYATIHTVTGHHDEYTLHAGGGPGVPPVQAGIWSAHAAGPGVQTLTWPVRSGSWTVVAMNADGSRPVSVRVSVAATLPSLPWVTAGLLTAGVLFLAGGVLLIVIPVRRASRQAAAPRPG